MIKQQGCNKGKNKGKRSEKVRKTKFTLTSFIVSSIYDFQRLLGYHKRKKSTIGNKSSVIEKTLNIGICDKIYSTAEIAKSFSFVEMPGGFIVPEKMANDMIKEFVIGIAKDDDPQEIDEFIVEKKRKEEEAEKAKRVRQAEINREKEEKKRKKKEELAKTNERQLKLW